MNWTSRRTIDVLDHAVGVVASSASGQIVIIVLSLIGLLALACSHAWTRLIGSDSRPATMNIKPEAMNGVL
jgi:hypothetical protein